jgi:hypothetical protein
MSGERETYPSERALAEAREEQSALRTHVAYPGRVQSYDATTQTADIVPLIRQQVPQPDGSYALEELPVMPSVPVVWPRVGAWFLAMALVPGDTVQLLCNTSAIGHWRTGTGDVTDPGDLRRQHLAHAVALPGLYTRGKALAHAPSGDTGLVLGSDTSGARVAFLANGTLRVTQGDATVLEVDTAGVVHLGGAAGELVALSNLVAAQLTALKTAINGAAVVPGDGGAAFKSNLMTALASWPGGVAAAKTKAT